jgi:hypothetical protein
MEVQVRSELTGLHYFSSIREALRYAKAHEDVWKISFDAENGERVRLVKDELTEFWVYEDLLDILLPCDIDEAVFINE